MIDDAGFLSSGWVLVPPVTPTAARVRPTSYSQITDGPWELAGRWSDRRLWRPVGQRTAQEEREEIAATAVLANWLRFRLIPAYLHAGMMAGATIPELAMSTGTTDEATAGIWQTWADPLRAAWHETGGAWGVPPDEYAHVAAIVTAETES